MIGIRCDANSIIASGHMMRCLTVAKEIVRQGHSVAFFVADEESEGAFRNMAADSFKDSPEAVSVTVLGTRWQDMEGELSALGKELSAKNISVLLVDSYKVTVTYFEKLKELCRVAYFDDLKADIYPVDILINYSGFYEKLGYEEDYKAVTGHDGEPTRLLMGLNYAPLREQFYRADGTDVNTSVSKLKDSQTDSEKSAAGLAEKEPERVSILLASGGADAYGMILGTLKAAKENGLVRDGSSGICDPAGTEPMPCSTAIDWHVVVGALCKDAEKIDDFAKANPGIHIHRSVSDMAGLMRVCDLAVCAAGTMLTECAAVGLPVIFYQVADNQKYNVEFFGNTGGMLFAGDVTEAAGGAAEVAQNSCRYIKSLMTGRRLKDMRSALSNLTDGRGAIRIAKALLKEYRS
ncbi:PseG/SpsG family protein [Butyrivibrio sp. FCS014]|uniref:PseG/SpsG family protein n=1 Tax=Butyrivibrio sp. FCS014 TaxID=1408304 RepID=UPI0004650E57|nr:glycosyltransferase [Butyrivibrio sp. FCS014]